MDGSRLHPKLAMERVVRRVGVRQERALRAAGIELTWPQATLLIVLNALGPQPVQRLAEELSIDQSAATRLVDRLERSGRVARSRSTGDGRVVLVSLTQIGRSNAAEAQAVIETLKKSLLAGISEADMNAFWRVLGHLEAATLDEER